jgi:hypothetical protein
VDRLVVVWCPSLLREGERGEEARTFLEVLSAVETFCPWVQPIRLGVCTLPARGPSRFFGGEGALTQRVALAVRQVVGPTHGDEASHLGVGVADGLFAATLAARSGLVVPPEGTAGFLSPWSFAVLQRPELAVTLQRLGVNTLGQFADLPTRHILARFGGDAVACHRVARGLEGELVGLRDPGIGRRLRVARGENPDQAAEAEDTTPVRQPGFFGGATEADGRAAVSFAQVQKRLGPEAVVMGRLRGGLGPAERAHLVPWGSVAANDQVSSPAPWPGRLPTPSPMAVFDAPTEAEVVDSRGAAVEVTGRGLLGAEPARLSVRGGPWQEVTAWAGPWPSTERWWSSRRRRARLQVVTATGVAFLLTVERARWWVEAIYD